MKNIKNNQRHCLCLGSKDNLKYNRAELAGIDADTIPTLIPADILQKWQAGDTAPKYKIQAIEYPIKANGYVYDESFFQTFVDGLKDRPYPGSKLGHEGQWGKRGATDFILVGGKTESAGDGKGIVYLKNYIPPIGESGDNEIFKRMLDSDMIHFSLVAFTKDAAISMPDGRMEWHVVEYKYGGRNDAVEYGTGAMQQKTNAKDIDENEEKEDDNEKANSAVGSEDIENGGNKMAILTEQELLDALNLHKNNALILPKILQTLGIESITDQHKNALKVVSDFNALGVTDPVNGYKTLKEKVEADALAVFNAKLDKEFGASTKDKPNLIRERAGEKIKLCATDEELKTQIEAFRNDPIAKKLAEDEANIFSKSNIIGISEGGKKENTQAENKNGFEVVKA